MELIKGKTSNTTNLANMYFICTLYMHVHTYIYIYVYASTCALCKIVHNTCILISYIQNI